MTEEYITSKDGFKIHIAYFPVENPVKLVQLVHGALEHKERYYPFIEYLNSKGYTCIINDHRGHGKSLDTKYSMGHMESYEELLDDMYLVTRYIKERNPGKELVMLGHSMGSMLARLYLTEHDDEITRLALTGTANYNKAAALGIKIIDLLKVFHGKYGYSKLVGMLSGVEADKEKWISYNKENIRKMEADELCGKHFTLEGNRVLVGMNKAMHDYSAFKCKNPALPILSVTGKDDPITGFKKGLEDSERTLRKIGYTNVKFVVHENMMHEVLNENNKELVFKEIEEFFR